MVKDVLYSASRPLICCFLLGFTANDRLVRALVSLNGFRLARAWEGLLLGSLHTAGEASNGKTNSRPGQLSDMLKLCGCTSSELWHA